MAVELRRVEERSEVGTGLPQQRGKHMFQENAKEAEDVRITKRLHCGQEVSDGCSRTNGTRKARDSYL